MEDLAEIASVQAAGGRDILHGDIVLEVLLDEGNSLFDVEIAQAVSSADLGGGSGTYKAVNKEKEVPDQVEGQVSLWEGATDWHDLWDEDGVIVDCLDAQ